MRREPRTRRRSAPCYFLTEVSLARRDATSAAAMAALAVVTASIRALGAAPPDEKVELAWVRGEGADSCPGQGQIAREVAARLGRDPFSSTSPRPRGLTTYKQERM